jgi:valyl-tRNA synthetase
MAALSTHGRDVKPSANVIEGYRNFATKLWNAARFAEMNGCAIAPGFDPKNGREGLNRWIAHEFAKAESEVTEALDAFRFNDAAAAVYRFVWNVYCDWYLELAKPVLTGPDNEAKSETRAMVAHVRDEILKLLHPFMPFVTEELWRVSESKRDGMLALAAWPQADGFADAEAESELGWVVDLITAIRSVRAEMNVPPAKQIPLLLVGVSDETKARAGRWDDVIKRLARINEIGYGDTAPAGSVQLVVRGESVALPIADAIDVAAERARLKKEKAKAEADIARVDAKLGNPDFMARAPEEVVEGEREKREDAEARLAKINQSLERMGGV